VGDSVKSLFLLSGSSEKNQVFTTDVQNDAPLPSCMHAVMLSPWVNAIVGDALRNAPVTP